MSRVVYIVFASAAVSLAFFMMVVVLSLDASGAPEIDQRNKDLKEFADTLVASSLVQDACKGWRFNKSYFKGYAAALHIDAVDAEKIRRLFIHPATERLRVVLQNEGYQHWCKRVTPEFSKITESGMAPIIEVKHD